MCTAACHGLCHSACCRKMTQQANGVANSHKAARGAEVSPKSNRQNLEEVSAAADAWLEEYGRMYQRRAEKVAGKAILPRQLVLILQDLRAGRTSSPSNPGQQQPASEGSGAGQSDARQPAEVCILYSSSSWHCTAERLVQSWHN